MITRLGLYGGPRPAFPSEAVVVAVIPAPLPGNGGVRTRRRLVAQDDDYEIWLDQLERTKLDEKDIIDVVHLFLLSGILDDEYH